MKTVSADENRFRELAALLPETVYEMDVSGRFTYVNPAGMAQFGYSERDYASGASAFDMIVPEDHPRARENIALAIAGKRVYQSEYTCLRKDGTTFPGVIYATVKYQNDKPLSLLGIIVDNSQQKQLEQKLRQWKARYQIASQAGLTGVWDQNLDTGEMVIDANLKNLLGFEDDEITRWDAWKRLFHPEDVRRMMKASRQYIKGAIPHFEVQGRVLDKQGHERWFLVRGVAERDATGRVRRLIGSATDITRFHRIERELKQAKDGLEAHVEMRTRELNEANQALMEVVREKSKTERRLKQREAELELKTAKLQDLNTALRVLLKKLEREKTAVEEKITADLRDLVYPYLKKLKRKAQQPEIHALITILENHLQAIVSPFSKHLTSPAINLTPAELNVAYLVRNGQNSRQIAVTLNVA